MMTIAARGGSSDQMASRLDQPRLAVVIGILTGRLDRPSARSVGTYQTQCVRGDVEDLLNLLSCCQVCSELEILSVLQRFATASVGFHGDRVMAHYYFDLVDGEEVACDEEGVDLPDMRSVQEEAAFALAAMAGQLPSMAAKDDRFQISIAVRDRSGPVLTLKFTFEQHRLQ
jgi:hypothetical protein